MRSRSLCRIEGVRKVGENIHVLTFHSLPIAREIRAGQFVSIRIHPGGDPLLRRPFSVYRAEGDAVQIVFRVVGRGTLMLSELRPGDVVDVLGPLGVPFGLERGDFSTAVLIGGGLGVAPLPLATAVLRGLGKATVTLLGAHTANEIVDAYLENPQISTDDGSRGMRGTVVELLVRRLEEAPLVSPKIFACGPNSMLRALGEAATARDIPCEVSLEGPMACGYGICQGCPVEMTGGDRRYTLMCTDGPVFDIRRIRIPA
jgi:dihydroorotate dehydrogenase electron transfer subunit